MSERQSLALTYTPLESGNEESRWIRLEQTQATLPSPSVGYMAEMLDYAFGIEACDDGLGGGGEGADESREPTEQELADMLSIIVTDASQCRQGHWLAAVNVYRTHEQPGYELRSETAKVERVDLVEESHQQVVDVDGPLIALERPYAGSLTGIPAGVNWAVRGGTVNLDRPVHDRLILRYETWHEHVTLRVPTKRTDDCEEYEAAAVVAFWGDMAAECELEPPEPEDPENQAAIDELCRKQRPEKPEPTDCWKTVRHYSMCSCSRKRFNEWEEQVGAPCDGASSGAQVGYEEKFDGFGWCEDDGDDELQDPEYYKKRCCNPPPKPLPRCRKTYADYNGGHEIESGPEHWKNIYGENVRMIPVLPKDGKCGELITEWNVPSKNCCDGVKPLRLDPNSAKEITEPEHLYWVQVLDGKDGVDFKWRTSGGIKIYTAAGGVTEYEGGRAVSVYFDEGACPEPGLTVTDGCSDLTITFRGPASDPPKLNANDLSLPGKWQFWLTASGGVPPYMWMASGGLKLLGYSPDGAAALFETGDTQDWCVETVTVVDQCGNEDTCGIRNADAGRWVNVPFDDPCNPPVRGGQWEGDPENFRHYTTPRGGYRLYTYWEAAGYYDGCFKPSWMTCEPGRYVSDGAESYLPTYCATRIPPAEVDLSCGCVREGSQGNKFYAVFSEFAMFVQKWVCG